MIIPMGRACGSVDMVFTIGRSIFMLCDAVSGAFAAWNLSRCGSFSCPYFPVFGLDTGKYGPEKLLHLGNFHAVMTEFTCGVKLALWQGKENEKLTSVKKF